MKIVYNLRINYTPKVNKASKLFHYVDVSKEENTRKKTILFFSPTMSFLHHLSLSLKKSL